MAMGLYKPGHGYWVRVLTATMLGIVTLATAAWAAGQAELLVTSLPSSGWQVDLDNVTGPAPEVGARVQLQAPGEQAGETRVLGTAEVASYDAANEFLVFRRVEMAAAEAEPAQTKSIVAGEFRGTVTRAPRGVTAVEPLYVQGGVMTVVILVGAALTYLMVGLKPRPVDFLIATDMEMKKVNWSTRKDITGSTWVVIGASFLIALALFCFDLFFRWFFSLIGVVAS